MSTQRVPVAGASCPSCTAGLDRLVVGGVGDWQTKILCEECHHVQRNLSFERTIVPLVAAKYGISEQAARLADERSQEEYLQVVLGGPVFDDLPPMPLTTRWVARRLALQSQL